MKKAQVTIFIIVAIVFVGIIILFFTFRDSALNPPVSDSSPVAVYVQSCLDSVAKDGVATISSNGGYYILPDKFSSSSYYPSVAFHLYDKTNLVPTKEKIEIEISNYIKNNIDYCFENFSSLKESGFSIEEGDKKEINTSIKEDRVLVNAKIPLSIKKGEESNIISDFNADIKPIYLPNILALINSIVDEQIKDTSKICMSCLANKSEKSGMKIEIFDTDDKNEFVYTIRDPASNFTNYEFVFNFAAKYNFPNCNNAKECLK